MKATTRRSRRRYRKSAKNESQTTLEKNDVEALTEKQPRSEQNNRNSVMIDRETVQAESPWRVNGYFAHCKNTLHAKDVPLEARDPHTMTGYRSFGTLSVRDCIRTMFSSHNEIVDIWSHLLPALAFIAYFIYVFKDRAVVGNPEVYPLLCIAIGGITFHVGSALAHLFSCLSLRANHLCFYMDYAAISIYSLTAGQSFYFYSRPSRTEWTLISSPALYLCGNMVMCLLNMLLSCASRHKMRSIRFYVRTLLYVFKWMYDSMPPFLRVVTCSSTADCYPPALTMLYLQTAFYAVAALVNAFRIPECWAPGTFDLIGRSHHIMHVFVTVAYYYCFQAGYMDMVGRAATLATLPQPTAFLTFGLLGILTVGNVIIGVLCARAWLVEEDWVGQTRGKYPVIYRRTGNYEQVNNDENVKK
ncbi:membrane progestin receptor gamma-A [Nematostella vectensis]|uniref:membrane progestin receptor gamma-A n=1 Tax=Nematostella vectensis TaxID=45351 RepID=UPI0013901DC1|nr:membrane progestin receptor gamma-A [Nematostella vectensis]